MMTRKVRWQDFTDGQKAALLTAASVQLSLAATAWADLATRPAADVRGRKSVWAAVIAINFVGPILYFARGRRVPRTLGGGVPHRRAGRPS